MTATEKDYRHEDFRHPLVDEYNEWVNASGEDRPNMREVIALYGLTENEEESSILTNAIAALVIEGVGAESQLIGAVAMDPNPNDPKDVEYTDTLRSEIWALLKVAAAVGTVIGLRGKK